jgi:hypothetical protein
MKPLVFLFVFILFSFSCKKASFRDCSEDEFSYFFYTSSMLDTTLVQGSLFYEIKPGNQIVFQYTHSGPDCKSIADEEYTEFLAFQIPATLSSFRFENNELTEQLTLYKRICFCPLRAVSISKGFIQGTRLSSTRWEIEINVDIPELGTTLSLKKIFLRKQ